MIQMSLYELVYLITNVFWVYTIYKFMRVFFDTRKTHKYIEIVTYIFFFAAISLIYLLVNIPVVNMVTNLIALFCLTYNYESTIKNRVISILLMYLVLMSVEMVVVLISGSFYNSIFETYEYSSIYGVIFSRVLTYAVVLVLNNFKNIKKGESVPNSYWFSLALIPIASLYLILLIFQAGLSVRQILSGIILIFLINFAVFYLYDVIIKAASDKIQSLMILEQNKYYNRQLDIMETALQTTKSIRHDLKNHMISIRTLTESGNIKEALGYISEIMDDIGAKKDYSASGNTVIDSIINFKLQEAEQRRIRTDLDLKIPNKLEIPSLDITVILGNLLDNAIKAASKVKNDPFITLKMWYDKGRLMIQMENPFNGVINEKNGKLLTTEADKENHGFGLQSIRKVIQKYDGTLDIDYSNNLFSITLLLYLD